MKKSTLPSHVPSHAFALKDVFKLCTCQQAQPVWSDEALAAAELHDLPLGLSALGGSNLCSDLREAAIHGGGVGFGMSFFGGN